MSDSFCKFFNGDVLSIDEVPLSEEDLFRESLVHAVKKGMRLISLFAAVPHGSPHPELWTVLGDDAAGVLFVGRCELRAAKFSSITPEVPQAHLFEREIWEQFGIIPVGHPWLKPVRFPRTLFKGRAGPLPQIGELPFYSIQGEEIHEVGVGPVHAGVIEPGHFRFQCHGESVLHLEISLGYQHRGVEEALLGGPHKHSPHQIETAAGDTSIGHSWAYALNLEALGGVHASARSEVIRAIALELERIANHVGDLGALSGDVGYLPTMSFCGRLRGDFLNLTALLCGSRLGRSLVRPGGVRFDLDDAMRSELLAKLSGAFAEVQRSVSLLWDAPSVLSRFENIGILTESQARDIGMVGVAARASGLERDVRINYPWGPYRFIAVPPAVTPGGDVYARAFARWLEIRRSTEFLKSLLDHPLPEGEIRHAPGPLKANHVAVSLIEGWRGEIAHVALTDAEGRFARYKIVDPSFHNWYGVSLALRGQQISDFPLCNKSFNLSYCGFDL